MEILKKAGTFAIVSFLLLSLKSYANYDLAVSGKKVVCDLGFQIELNSRRTKMTIFIGGAEPWKYRIRRKETDGRSFMRYYTDDGVITLSDSGDTYHGGICGTPNCDPLPMQCRIAVRLFPGRS